MNTALIVLISILVIICLIVTSPPFGKLIEGNFCWRAKKCPKRAFKVCNTDRRGVCHVFCTATDRVVLTEKCNNAYNQGSDCNCSCDGVAQSIKKDKA